MDIQAILNRVTELLKYSGHTEAELYEACSLSPLTISQWESGDASPSAKLLLGISNFFQVSYDYLVSGEMGYPSAGKRIRTLRKAAKLTQTELGSKIGVKTNAVSKWECGRVRNIPADKLRAMSLIFGVSISYLIDGEDGSESQSVEIEGNFGQKIKHLRMKNNLTLEQVAQKVSVGKSTVRKWENGIIVNVRSDKIVPLAAALNTSPAYLMGWEGNGVPPSQSELFHRVEQAVPSLNRLGLLMLSEYLDVLMSSEKRFKKG